MHSPSYLVQVQSAEGLGTDPARRRSSRQAQATSVPNTVTEENQSALWQPHAPSAVINGTAGTVE